MFIGRRARRLATRVVALGIAMLCVLGLAGTAGAADDLITFTIKTYVIDWNCSSATTTQCPNRVPVYQGVAWETTFPASQRPTLTKAADEPGEGAKDVVEDPTRDWAPCGRRGYKHTTGDLGWVRFHVSYDIGDGPESVSSPLLSEGLWWHELWRYQTTSCDYVTAVSERSIFRVAFINGTPAPGEVVPQELPPTDDWVPTERLLDLEPCVRSLPDELKDAARSALTELHRAGLSTSQNPCQLATELEDKISQHPPVTDVDHEGVMFRCANHVRKVGITALGVDAGELEVTQYICAGKDASGHCEVTNGTWTPPNGDPTLTRGTFAPPDSPMVSVTHAHDLLSINPGGPGGTGVVSATRVGNEAGQPNRVWQVQIQVNVRIKSPVGSFDVLKTIDIVEKYGDLTLCD